MSGCFGRPASGEKKFKRTKVVTNHTDIDGAPVAFPTNVGTLAEGCASRIWSKVEAASPSPFGVEANERKVRTIRTILAVVGTRPEVVKMAPVIHALREDEAFSLMVCVTGQHREMLDQALEAFSIIPDYDLNLMKPGQDLAHLTSSALEAIRGLMMNNRPDAVLVHGDTTTTLATAMASFYSHIPVGHVEAGLRTYNLQAPYPEEFNRQVISKIARWHFAPTERSARNLVAEGIGREAITLTGNTVIDSLEWMLGIIDSDPLLKRGILEKLDEMLPFLWRSTRFVLVTGHRRENLGDGFLEICEALRALSGTFPSVHFVYPVHLNPRVRGPVFSLLGGLPNVQLLEPLDYNSFLYLLKHCHLVLTDSGGIQEEAPSMGKPVLVMRDVTERPEGVEAGTAELVGSQRAKIVSSVSRLLSDQSHYEKMSRAHNPFGDGAATERIMQVLRKI